MDRDGIDVAVTLGMGWQVHGFAVEANDYILESAKALPDRLVPFLHRQPCPRRCCGRRDRKVR